MGTTERETEEMPQALRARTPEDQRRLESFERRMALPLFLSAVVPIVMTLAGGGSVVATIVLVVTWFVFVVDFVVHVRLVPAYVRSGRGVFDLVVVVLTAPWFLIPGRGDARFLALARLGRLARVVHASGGALRRLVTQLGQVGLIAGLLIVSGGYVTYSAERAVNDEFATFGDAVWWATVTITTVGYGDIVPITRAGRVTAAILMFAGLAVLGVLAGSLASFFGLGGSPATAEPEPEPDVGAASRDVDELRARLADLDRAVAAVRQHLP